MIRAVLAKVLAVLVLAAALAPIWLAAKVSAP